MARLLLWVLLTIAHGCGDSKPFLRQPLDRASIQISNDELRSARSPQATFYALGDWGTGGAAQAAVAKALAKNVSELPRGRRAPFVLGLGDNIYNNGLPQGWNDPVVEELLEKTFGSIYSDVTYEGQPVVFHIVPGNHDYSDRAGADQQWGDVIHQETTAERLYENWRYYPIDPAKNLDSNDSTDYHALAAEDIFELSLPQKIESNSDGLVSILALDTQVLLHLYERSDKAMLAKHWEKLAELLRDDPAPWKILMGHHPIRTHGKHGGFVPGYFWLPPIVLFTLYDRLLAKRLQDLDNGAYIALQREMEKQLIKYNVSIYVAGHDHNLQLLEIDDSHFQVVSGSAGKRSRVSHESDTLFSHSAYGFVRFDVTATEMWIEFFAVDAKSADYQSTGIFKISK